MKTTDAKIKFRYFILFMLNLLFLTLPSGCSGISTGFPLIFSTNTSLILVDFLFCSGFLAALYFYFKRQNFLMDRLKYQALLLVFFLFIIQNIYTIIRYNIAGLDIISVDCFIIYMPALFLMMGLQSLIHSKWLDSFINNHNDIVSTCSVVIQLVLYYYAFYGIIVLYRHIKNKKLAS
ncbi:hypothetical protein K1X76_06225 [bacterium]|nr:hypothetical protein [bacterium]